ncbi:hypothetical protein Fmac_031601 [Flemingia macrophylla]|uniref:Uncharacterized protein n=1 Tax=Flemingia macrophylla TaxID=520843 RepID=A0ABD1L2I3_9FABA
MTSATAQTFLALTSFPVSLAHPLSPRDRHLRAIATATSRATAIATSATALTSGPSPLSLSSPFTPRDPEADRCRRRDSHHDWPFTSPLTCPPSGVSPSVIIPLQKSLQKTLNLSTLSLEKTLNHCRDPNICLTEQLCYSSNDSNINFQHFFQSSKGDGLIGLGVERSNVSHRNSSSNLVLALDVITIVYCFLIYKKGRGQLRFGLLMFSVTSCTVEVLLSIRFTDVC